MVLALIAVLAVAGPGLVLAGSPGTSYPRPQYADIKLVLPVCNGASTQLSLEVVFSDGSKSTVSSASEGVTWVSPTRAGGTIDSSGNYTAPASGAKDMLTATYSNGVGKGTANRVIVLGGSGCSTGQ
jgi:hypothetical protein